MEEAFICSFVRTPIGRYGGVLATVRTDDLAALPLQALTRRHPELDLDAIDEVILGCANQAGEDNRNVARMAVLLAGFPVHIAATTINRLCASGMDAIVTAARAIRAGEAQLIIAGGVESMSRAPFVLPKATCPYSRETELYDSTMGWRFINSHLASQYGVESMPETGENVAAEYEIVREDQDAFAYRSQQRARQAHLSGRLAQEISPVSLSSRGKDHEVVSVDEHPRPNTTLQILAQLPTPFRVGGTVTAGNASGINDGAAALIVSTEKAMVRYGLEPLARVVGAAAVGVPPRIMGIGPVPATNKLCGQLGCIASDFDVIEINEAFASQAIASLRALGIPEDAPYVNPNGGAIALGHPLGMSGARLCGTAALEIRLSGKRTALATMCVGVGQGVAVALGRA